MDQEEKLCLELQIDDRRTFRGLSQLKKQSSRQKHGLEVLSVLSSGGGYSPIIRTRDGPIPGGLHKCVPKKSSTQILPVGHDRRPIFKDVD